MYSERREALFKYVPDNAAFDSTTKTYNVLDQFTASVLASPSSSDPSSPEFEILQLLATPDDAYVETFTNRINAYLAAVNARVASNMQAATDDYMVLAEGRRRLYKGREDQKPDGSGLNEFQLTLPMAMKPEPFPITRMTESGDVEVMPEAHVAKFMKLAKSRGDSAGGCPVLQRKGQRSV
jgi:hypothetical protein